MSIIKKSIIVISALLLVACAGKPPQIAIPAKAPKPLVLAKRPNVALVLGSGGARGYAHIGVLQVLEQAGVPINLIVGASAGSIIGSLYADDPHFSHVYQKMFNASFWDFADIKPGLKGVITGYHLDHFMLTHMRARRFDQLKIPLVVATTDFNTGLSYPISNGPIVPTVQASTAIPSIMLPVHLYGRTLIDGGIADPIPVDLAKAYNPKVTIAVNISKALPIVQPKTSYGIYKHSIAIIWNRLSILSAQPADIVIRPHVGDIGTFDIKAKKQLYLEGIAAGKKALPKILKLLKANHIPLKNSHQSKVEWNKLQLHILKLLKGPQ